MLYSYSLNINYTKFNRQNNILYSSLLFNHSFIYFFQFHMNSLKYQSLTYYIILKYYKNGTDLLL